MDRTIFKQTAAAVQNRRRQRSRRRTFTALAAVVVFVTVYLLILPAITMEREQTCPLEEHQHTEECYTENLVCELSTEPEEELVCGLEEFEGHTHDLECLPADAQPYGEPVCGLPEEDGHIHDLLCYEYLLLEPESEPLLLAECWCCGLEESEGHVHTAECYQTSEPHVHGPECYEQVLTCELEEHTHTDECFAPLTQVYCGKEEHTHSGDCYSDAGRLICELEEHQHTEECLVEPQEPEYFCGKEGHTHSGDCFDADGSLICTLEEHEHDLNCLAAPKTYCGLEAHMHGETCYDELGELICGLEAHEHTEECFAAPEYFCGKDEHVHNGDCFDADGNLICGLEEHVHTGECLVEPTYYCGKEAHTHGEACYNELGELACGLEEHEHSGECLSLDGVQLRRVEDPSQLDPDTAYAIVMEQEGETYLVRSDSEGYPNLQPIRIQPITDENGEAWATFEITEDLEAEMEAEAEAKAEAEAEARMAEAQSFRSLERDSEYAAFGIAPTAMEETFLPENETETDPLALPLSCLWAAEEEMEETVLLSNLNAADVQMEAEGQAGAWAVNNLGVMTYETEGPADRPFALYAAGIMPLRETAGTGRTCGGDCGLTNTWDDWKKPTGANPFGGAQDFNLFLLGDLTDWGVVHGNAAVMGNINGVSNDISYDAGSNFNYAAEITPKFDVGLILGGINTNKDKEKVTINNGSVICSQKAYDENNLLIDDIRDDGDHFHVVEQKMLVEYGPAGENGMKEAIGGYFAEAKDDLCERNRQTYDYAAGLMTSEEGSLERDRLGSVRWITMDMQQQGPTAIDGLGPATTKEDLYLSGTDPFVNIFNLYADMVSTNGGLARNIYMDVPYGSYVIFNVIGEVSTDCPADGGHLKADFIKAYDNNKPDYDDGDVVITHFGPVLWMRDSKGNFHDMHDRTTNDNYMQTRYIMYNFDPRIEEADVCLGGYVFGSILAPNLDWVTKNGISINVEGTIVLEDAMADGTIGTNPSAFLYAPYIPGAEGYSLKEAVCDDNKDDDKDQCPLDPEEDLESNIPWNTYFADLTMECLDDVVGSVKTFTIKGIPVSRPGSYGIANARRTDGMAPGNYRIVKEEFYVAKTDAQGNVVLDKKGYPVRKNPDELVSFEHLTPSHYFSHVSFAVGILDEEENVVKKLEVKDGVLTIPEGGVQIQIAVVNHYSTKEGFPLRVKKQWLDQGGLLAPDSPSFPHEAIVQVQLYRTHSQMAKDGERFRTVANISERSAWEVSWPSVPQYEIIYDENGDKTEAALWYYYAVETITWPGFDPVSVYFPAEGKPNICKDNVPETDGLKYADIVVQNKKNNVDTTKLTVEKKWLDENGIQFFPEAGSDYSATMQLYQEKGVVKDKSVKITVKLEDLVNKNNYSYEFDPIYVASGSDVEFSVPVWFTTKSGDATIWMRELPLYFQGKPIMTSINSGILTNDPNSLIHGDGNEYTFVFTGKLENVTQDQELVFSVPRQSETTGVNKIDRILNDRTTDKNGQVSVTEHPKAHAISWSGVLQPCDPAMFEGVDEPGGSVTLPLKNAPDPSDPMAKWRYTWTTLLSEGEFDLGSYPGNETEKAALKQLDPDTEYYRYYVLETATNPGGVDTVYTVGHQDYEIEVKPTGEAEEQISNKLLGGMSGIHEGIITVTNQEQPGYALPETGGAGTALFTGLGALLLGGGLTGGAVNHLKRRKGDRRNRPTK